jgi:alpha-L-fucosidase
MMHTSSTGVLRWMNQMQTAGKRLMAIVALVFVVGVVVAIAQNAAPAKSSYPDLYPYSEYAQQRAKFLADVDKEATQGPFQPNWESLKKYKAPQWYEDAKLGIFIHWGVYSVPAFANEWYPRNMYQQGTPEFKHQVETYGPQTKFGYKDFIPLFTAKQFDAAQWANLFRQAGAKYVVQVAEHHDGFPMYESSLTDWCAGKMGPKRDLVAELSKGVREAGLYYGVSSHRAEHWFFFNGGWQYPSDVQDPRFGGLYAPAQPWISVKQDGKERDVTVPSKDHLDEWLARSAELVERYHPDVLYFDWWIEQKEFQPYLERFAAFYYNDAATRGAVPVLETKESAFPEGASVFDIERGQSADIRPLHWQTDTSISDKSWGYIENDTFKSPQSIIWQLVDIVSKNGNLLLNFGPRPDGTIPEQVQHVLLTIGKWLAINGEAIYGTRPWTIYGEGPTQVVGGSFHDTASQPFTSQDVRFTTKGSSVYAIVLAWPKVGQLIVHSLGTGTPTGKNLRVGGVTLLGSDSKLEWKQEADGLHIRLPAQAPGEFAFSFRIALKTPDGPK